MSPIKVVIIDDNKSIRRIVKELLETESDLSLCGEAEDIESGKTLLMQQSPDVAIIDISLGENEGGFKVLQEINDFKWPTKVIMFSAHSEETYSGRCLKAGAQAYLCKDKAVGCLVEAIRCVHAGEEYVS